jgi:hypothetical protein
MVLPHKRASLARHEIQILYNGESTGEMLVRKAVRNVHVGSAMKEAENPGRGLIPEALRQIACMTIKASVPRRTDRLLRTGCL